MPPGPNSRRVDWQQGSTKATDQYRIESADVSQLIETTNAELVEQINSASRQIRHAPFAVLITVMLSVGAFFAVSILTGVLVAAGLPDDETTKSVSEIVAMFAGAAILVAGGVFSWRAHVGDELKRTTPLFYEMERGAAEHFAAVRGALTSVVLQEFPHRL